MDFIQSLLMSPDAWLAVLQGDQLSLAVIQDLLGLQK